MTLYINKLVVEPCNLENRSLPHTPHLRFMLVLGSPCFSDLAPWRTGSRTFDCGIGGGKRGRRGGFIETTTRGPSPEPNKRSETHVH